jgi:hypothetical protein
MLKKIVVIFLALIFVFSFFLGKKKNVEKTSIENQNIIQGEEKYILDSIEKVLYWNYREVKQKLGAPVWEDSFSMAVIPEFRIELLNYLPRDSNLIVKELTWNKDSVNYITVWYILKENEWEPITFSEYDKLTQF